VIGVTSFNNTGFPGAMFGPYLHAAQVNSLLQFTTDGCKSK